MKRIAFPLLSLLLASAAPALADVREDFTKTVEAVRDGFRERYALAPWKEREFGWTIDGAARMTLRRGAAEPELTADRARELVQDFFYSARDYHAKASYVPGGSASLPIAVRSLNRRVYVTSVAANCGCGIQVGDEVLEFDGVPAYRAILAHVTTRFPNHRLTDLRDGDRRLTNPFGRLMEKMPIAPTAELKVQGLDGQVRTVSLPWTRAQLATAGRLTDPEIPAHRRVPRDLIGWSRAPNPNVGPRGSTFVKPERVLWESAPGAFFEAWIEEVPDGKRVKRVGRIRIPTFALGPQANYAAAIQEFEATIAKMEESTDALILDELGNGGGSADYMYALASYLFDREVPAFKFSYRLFDGIVESAKEEAAALADVATDEAAREYFGDHYFGYPVDLDFAKQVREFYRGIVEDAAAGRKFGKYRPYNIAKIKPNPRVRYRKKLFVLANAYSASVADFFPALLQDTRRGEVIGEWTAGAGAFTGAPYTASTPLGVNSMVIPIAMAQRLDGRTPIENLGVWPNHGVSSTKRDYREGYSEYRKRVLDYVRRRL